MQYIYMYLEEYNRQEIEPVSRWNGMFWKGASRPHALLGF